MQRRAVILQLRQLGGALLVFDLTQLCGPSAGCVFKPAGSLAQRIDRRGNASITLGGDLTRVRAQRLSAVNDDQLRLLTERTAEAKPEVHRHADHDSDVGLLQRLAAGAGEEELVVGRDASAS